MLVEYFCKNVINGVVINYNHFDNVLNPERSEKCINFSIMCVFCFVFVSVYTILGNRSGRIFNIEGTF